jgi:hypothetical protein
MTREQVRTRLEFVKAKIRAETGERVADIG